MWFGTHKKRGYDEPHAHFFAPKQVSTFNQSTIICYSTIGHLNTLYGTSTPPLKCWSSCKFFPFATTQTALYHFSIGSIHWLFSPQHGSWPFYCILLTPFHTSPSPFTTLFSPFPAIHPTPLPYTFYQQQNAILSSQLTFFTVPPVIPLAFSE